MPSYQPSRRLLIDVALFGCIGLPAVGAIIAVAGDTGGLIAALALPLWMVELCVAATRDRQTRTL